MRFRIIPSLLLLVLSASVPAFAEEGQVTSSLSSLLSSGQSLSCTFTKADPVSPMSGTSYLANGKMRGDFDITHPDIGPTQMHMIRDGEWNWMWGGHFGEGRGLKTRASENPVSPTGERAGPDLDETMDFQCQPWRPNPAKFEPPAGVDFQEMAMPMGRVPQGADMRAMQCAACEQAPEDSRAQCLQMLGCV